MKFVKNYNSFLNESESVAEGKLEDIAAKIPFKEWYVDHDTDPEDGYHYAVAKYKGKYYGCWGAVVNAGGDLEDVDFDLEVEEITRSEYEAIS